MNTVDPLLLVAAVFLSLGFVAVMIAAWKIVR